MGSLLQISHKTLLALMAWAIQSILGSVDLGNLHVCSVDALERGGGQDGEEEHGNCQLTIDCTLSARGANFLCNNASS